MARFVFQGTWFDGQNSIVPSGTITVYLAGTLTLATAYESEAGAALTNSQTTTDSAGALEFWIDDGDFDSTQKFRFIGTKTGFANLDKDNLQIIISNASTTETLSNKTFTLPQINDTSADHQYVIAVNELTGDRTVTLPLLTANDTFVFANFIQTLTGKNIGDPADSTKDIAFTLSGATTAKTLTLISAHTDDRSLTLPDATDTLVGKATTDTLTAKTLTSPVLNTQVTGTAVLDEDDMASDSAVKVATQQSIKKYVDDNSINLSTEQASGSGTAIDFTGIPAGTKKITIMLVDVSADGTVDYIIQIGDAGGIETSGYKSATIQSGTAQTATDGFVLTRSVTGGSVLNGQIILSLQNASTFTWTGSHGLSVGSDANIGGGSKSLSAELDRVRITTQGTPDDFDAGAINIQFEGIT